MKKLFFLPVALLMLASCGSSENREITADSTQKQVSGFASHQFDGLFADTMPCADCAGIITRLNLEADSTFVLEQEYVGLKEGDRVFYQLGKWSLVDSLLRLSEITEGPRQYKIVNTNELKMLDNEGSMITGTSLNYTLHRQNSAFVPKKTLTVRGMAIVSGDSSFIKICSWQKDIPLEITATTTYADSVAVLKRALQHRVMTEVEGRFSIVDRAGKSVQVFTADKFVKYAPGEKCRE